MLLVSFIHFMYTFYPTRPFRHPVQVTILREETLHRMSCHKESEVFFLFTATYIWISRLQCHRREIAHKVQAKLRTSYLGTTETTDPVQWIQQLYNEDVS